MWSVSSKFFVVIFLLLSSAVFFSAPENAQAVRLAKTVDPFLLAGIQSPTSKGAHLVTALITSPSPLSPSQLRTLRSFGTVTSSVGRVTVLETTLNDLEEVMRLDLVSGAFLPRTFRPTLDVSAPEIGAVFVWENVTDIHGLHVDGSGIVVGVIDTGVDLSHPDLKFPNGTSKVLYLWDQTASGTPPRGFTYGVECSWSQINDGKCRENDTFGHGTHVASIAASSGLASGMYRGIAPGASLIVVKAGKPLCGGDNWSYDENAIIDGLAYVVERARALGMRLVVNLSFGGTLGGHDDTSPLEIALDDLSAQGIVVAVSAGNEADSGGHATGSVGSIGPVRVSWELNDGSTSAMLDLWYPLDGDMSTTLVTPSGQSVRGPTPTQAIKTSDGLITILQANTAKGKEWAILLEHPESLKLSGWSVILSSTGGGRPLRWDAWIDGDSCSYPPATFSSGEGYAIEEAGTVTIPATASRVISVGAYVTKNSWVSMFGENVKSSRFSTGELASFSSRGPTRDGRTKPDISAPGLFIAAARSLDVPSSRNDPDKYHRVLAGTSMAAPHIAGLVALIMQYNPQLTSEKIRALLTEGSNLDRSTGFIEPSKGSNEWGWGKADARTATKLFRVSSFVPSLPPKFAVKLTIDGELHGLLSGGEVLTECFPNGNVHTFQVSGATFTANRTRYLVHEDRAVFASNAVFTPDMRIQYLLSLESSLGHVEGEGWYDAGSRANFTVTPVLSPGGLGRLLGVTFVFDHWVDEHGNKVSSWLLMDSPHLLKASWKAQLTNYRPTLLLITLIAVFVLLLELGQGNLRRRWSGGR